MPQLSHLSCNTCAQVVLDRSRITSFNDGRAEVAILATNKGRKEGRKEGGREGGREGRKEGRKEEEEKTPNMTNFYGRCLLLW